jgi:hypothetical protein
VLCTKRMWGGKRETEMVASGVGRGGSNGAGASVLVSFFLTSEQEIYDFQFGIFFCSFAARREFSFETRNGCVARAGSKIVTTCAVSR